MIAAPLCYDFYAACGIRSEMIRDTPGRSIVTP
jgi:hypothetical protein